MLSLTCIVMTCMLMIVKKRVPMSSFTTRDIFLSVLVIWCVTLVLFTHLPVTADRSISVYLLGHMNRHADESLSDADIESSIINTYIVSHEATEKRINEQLASHTIQKQEGGYRITPRGKLLMRLYVWIADVFGLDGKNFSE